MPLSATTPTCAFIPKNQSFPFLVDDISGSRALASFLVEDGASMMVASTSVPERSMIPWSARWRFVDGMLPCFGIDG